MDQGASAVGVVLTLFGGGVDAVGVAVDEGDRAEAIDALLGVVGKDGLGPAALRRGLDAGLEVGAIVADEGRAGRVLEGDGAVLVVAHQVHGGLGLSQEILPGLDVGQQGLGAFGLVRCAAAKGTEVEAVAEMDAHGRLVVLDELEQGVLGFVVDHVAVVVPEGDEAGGRTHLVRPSSRSSLSRMMRAT